MNLSLLTASGQQRRLVDQILEVGARESRGRGGKLRQAGIMCERNLAGVDLENRFASGPVRKIDYDTPIETSGSQERLVKRRSDPFEGNSGTSDNLYLWPT